MGNYLKQFLKKKKNHKYFSTIIPDLTLYEFLSSKACWKPKLPYHEFLCIVPFIGG